LAPASTSRVTTAPAPTIARSPIVTPLPITAPAPMKTLSPIWIDAPTSAASTSGWSVRISRSWSPM